jgi:hypothetical protein
MFTDAREKPAISVDMSSTSQGARIAIAALAGDLKAATSIRSYLMEYSRFSVDFRYRDVQDDAFCLKLLTFAVRNLSCLAWETGSIRPTVIGGRHWKTCGFDLLYGR